MIRHTGVGARFISVAYRAALLAIAVACSAKQSDTGDGQSDDEPSNAGDQTQSETQSTTNSEQTVTAISPIPPTAGELDSCTSSTWTHPSEQKRNAACTQHSDDTALRYVCSCDVNECPLYVFEDTQPNTPSIARLNDCVVDGVRSGCDDSLLAACGSMRGQHGYCERNYDGLTPTRPDQNPPVSVTVVCFEQSDGTHACQCPSETELVPTDETDCERALLTTCQMPCDSEAGNCTPTEASSEHRWVLASATTRCFMPANPRARMKQAPAIGILPVVQPSLAVATTMLSRASSRSIPT
jgi:hypothetical protein